MPTQEITLEVPIHGDRFLKMFWTVQRVNPVTVRWVFASRWLRDAGHRYITTSFKHRDLVAVELAGERELTMVYREIERGAADSEEVRPAAKPVD